MSTAPLYKNPAYDDPILTEEGAPFPDAGLPVAVPLSDYYAELVLAGPLVTYEADNGNSTVPKTGTVDVTANLVITVDLGPGIGTETAYRDGAFLFPYLASTLNTGTGAYSLVREGGWPSAAAVVPVEPPAIPTGGQAWGAIYTLDLTTQATQTISAAGSYTIDGKTWWSKGGTPFNSGNFNELLNGSGLRPAAAAFGHSGNYPYQSLWFPMLQLADFNINAPYCVAFRWTGSLDSSHYVVGGLSSLPDNATNVLTGDRSSQNLISYDGDTPTHIIQGTLSNTGMGSALGAVSGWVFYTPAVASRVASTGRRAFAGAPLDADVQNLSLSINPLVIDPAANPGFWLTCNNTDTVAYLTHLAVFQPRV